MAECPTCGEGYDDKTAMRQHHTMAHGESLVAVTLTCSDCGEDFTRPQYDVVDAENYYCSYECRRNVGEHECPAEECSYTSNSKLGIQQHHKRTHGESLTATTCTCKMCGSEFQLQESEVENGQGATCSAGCWRKWVAKQNSGENHYDYNKKEVMCDTCGKMIKRPKGHRERTKRNFCDRECYHVALEDDFSGQDNPRWRGGYEPYYGPSWHPQRRKALERDDHECQDCKLTREKHYEQYDTDLEVHHITPIRTFADTSKANELSNLITLCKSCHTKREHS